MAMLTEEEFERSKRIRKQAATGFLHARTGANNPYRVSLSEIESYLGRREAVGDSQVLLRTKSGDEKALMVSVDELDELMREWSKPVIGLALRERTEAAFLQVQAGDGAEFPARINLFQIESYHQVTNRDRLVRVRTKTGDDHWVHGTVEELDKWIDGWWRER